MSDAVAIRAPGVPLRRAAPAARAPAEAQFSLKRLAAFIFMVFGMFMAILDIQIVSASLSQIQAGLSASSDEAERPAWICDSEADTIWMSRMAMNIPNTMMTKAASRLALKCGATTPGGACGRAGT